MPIQPPPPNLNQPLATRPQGAQMPYGYGQDPNSSNRGYYEQQTPMGSFAATDFARSQNPYIGQTTQGINGQPSVMGYAQQVANAGGQANPYLDRTTQQSANVGSNPYGMGNPYLDQQIASTTSEAARGFNNVVNPQFDRMAQASGSFGNTGVEAARGQAQQDFGKNLASQIGGMRMQDYTQQQQLAEAGLNRAQQNNQFNSNLSAGDLARQTSGQLGWQGLNMQGRNALLQGGQFDATLGNNTNQFNASLADNGLGRNSSLAQQLGMFNAGNQNTANMFNAGAANNMLGQQRNLNQQADQFGQNMDFNVYQANNQNMRNGQLDQFNMLDRMLGWNQQGINNATNVQNTPLNYYTQFSNTAGNLGGMGGTNSQNLQGNPWLGAIGGYQLGSRIGG